MHRRPFTSQVVAQVCWFRCNTKLVKVCTMGDSTILEKNTVFIGPEGDLRISQYLDPALLK